MLPSSKLGARGDAGPGRGRRKPPPLPPGDEHGPRAGRHLLIAAAALVAVVALTVSASLAQRPPAPLPASAPPGEFSAERAWTHLERITGDEPTPVGSAAGDDVRDYLIDELSALGLDTELQRGTGVFSAGGVSAGRVDNVVATLPGRDTTRTVAIAAHYDTTFGSPGATDDKASVAAILETARALTSGGTPRNDILFLLSDGEEPGMLGASAFAEQHRAGSAGGVLLNWEGPGNAGPSTLFQTSRGAADVVEGFADYAPHPVGTSMVPSLFHLLSNHTDLTVLDEAGWVGATWGFMDGRAYYHSSQDTVGNFDQASLQQHGENLLALARGFGERDLSAIGKGADVTFFSAFGAVVRYPNLLVWPLAGLALALVVAVAVAARMRRLVTVPRLLAGAGTALLPIVVAAAATVGLWELLAWLRPGYAAMAPGDTYRPELYRWALGVLTVAIVLLWYVSLRRRIGAAAMAAGALVWPAVVGLGCAALVPGMSFVGALPATTAAIGGLVAVLARAGWLRVVALTTGIAPGVHLLLVAGGTTLAGFGVTGAAMAVPFFVLAALVALPLLELAVGSLARRRAATAMLPATAAALAAALAAGGLAVDRFDAGHPRPAHLMYVLDAGAGEARWASTDAVPHEWVTAHAPDPAAAAGANLPLPYFAEPVRTGAAEATPLPAPTLTVLDTRAERGGTVLTVEIASRRDADVLILSADRPVRMVAVTAGDYPPVTARPDSVDRPWPFQLRFYDPPAEGVRIRLWLEGAPDGAGPRLALTDYTVGLAGLPGYDERPPELTRTPRHWGDLVVVGRVHRR